MTSKCITWPRFRHSVVGSTSSSPVESTAIVGGQYTCYGNISHQQFTTPRAQSILFNTFTIITPTVASRPISEAPSLSPDFKTTASFSMSHPCKSLHEGAYIPSNLKQNQTTLRLQTV